MSDTLFDRAASAVNTSWYYSWYWERRGDSSTFSVNGVRKALDDCRSRIADAKADLLRLELILSELIAEEVVQLDGEPTDAD